MLKDRTSFAEFLVAGILTAIVLALMVTRWQTPGGIWRDEAACVQLSLMPTIGDLWRNFEHEAFPPTFPLLIRGYLSVFGSSDLALKSFGLAVSCLLAGSIWLTAVLVRSAPPLLSLSLLGLNSSVLVWGSVIRGYGLASVLIPLFYASLFRYRETPGKRWALAAVITGVLSVQCAIQNWLLVSAVCCASALASGLTRQYRTAFISLVIGGLIGLSVLPYLPQYLNADWRHVVKGTMTLRDYLGALFFNLGQPAGVIGVSWIGLLLASTVIAGLVALRRPDVRSSLLFGLFTGVLSLAVSLSFFLYMSYSARAWHFIPLLTLLACNLEMLLANSLSGKSFRWGRLLLVGLFLAAFLRPTWHLIQNRLTNLDEIVTVLKRQAHRDDLVVACPWYYGVSMRWYYDGPCRWLSMPIIGDQPVHRYDLVLQRMKSPDPLQDLQEEIEQTLRDGHDVWIVGHLLNVPEDGPRQYAPAPDPVVQWSEDNYVGSWMEQMTWFLATHTQSQRLVEVPVEEPIAVTENLNLWRIRGWK